MIYLKELSDGALFKVKYAINNEFYCDKLKTKWVYAHSMRDAIKLVEENFAKMATVMKIEDITSGVIVSPSIEPYNITQKNYE